MNRRFVIVALLVGAVTCLAGDFPANRLSDELTTALRAPTKIILLSLDPNQPEPNGEPQLHRRKVLGQVELTDPKQRLAAATALTDAIAAFNGVTHGCFEPRHDLRVTANNKTYDFLICFECSHLMVYSGGERLAYLHLAGSPQPLNDILTAAKVPLPKPPQE